MATTYTIDAGGAGDYLNFTALLAADVLLDGDTVEVNDNGVIDDVGDTELTITKSITVQKGTGPNKPIIKCKSNQNQDSFKVSGNNVSCTFKDLVFYNHQIYNGNILKIISNVASTIDSCLFHCLNIPLYPAFALVISGNGAPVGTHTVKNCLFYSQGNGGLVVEACVADVYNNTFVGNGGSIGIAAVTAGSTVTIKNSIIENYDIGIYGRNDVGSTQNYNTIYNCVTDLVNFSAGPNNVTSDPLWAGNYSILSNSPCIDAGTDLGITPDIDGVSRPQGVAYDIGAYERVSGSLDAPNLISPIEDVTGVSITPTLSWATSAGATFYTLSIGKTPKANDDTYVLTETSKVLDPLEGNTVYYWKVLAQAESSSAWSLVQQFTTTTGPTTTTAAPTTTTSAPLPAPILLTPAKGALNISLNPTLSWEEVATADTYRLQVSTDSLFSSFIINESLVNTTRVIGPLQNNTTYYWRVRASNETSISGFSIRNFKTIEKSIYYANLDLPGIGGSGTEGDPWFAETFKTQMDEQLNGNSLIKVKGSHDFDSQAVIIQSSGGDISITNWLDTPWKIRTSLFYIKGNSKIISVESGIIQADEFKSFNTVEMYNCFLKSPALGLAPQPFNIQDGSTSFYGCTIACKGIAEIINGVAINLVDCIIDGQITKNTGSVTINARNCALTASSKPAGLNINNQYNWVAPIWPDWDAARSSFSSFILSSGINSPTEPGNPPYTGYETGLWESERLGIGSLFFTGQPVSIGSIKYGVMQLSFDGISPVRSSSNFNFHNAGFEISAELRQAIDPVFFSIYNDQNTATFVILDGNYVCSLLTGGETYKCWGHLDLETSIDNQYFTDYICVSSSDIENKSVSLTHLIGDVDDIAVNIVGGTSQELGTDFYIQDNQVKWDGKALDGEINYGDILRVIYIAEGLSNPARIKFVLKDNIMSVYGQVNGHFTKLMRRTMQSSTAGSWGISFYMRELTNDERSFFFSHFDIDDINSLIHPIGVVGRGYISKFLAIADSFSGTDKARPYENKTWRQPLIVYK